MITTGKPILFTLAALALSAQTAQAGDPTIGFGFTFVFGGGAGVGVKVFADDEREEATATLGVDYMFEQGWRPNIGIAYILDGNGYIGGDIGYNFARDTVDFGIGAGVVDSDTPRATGGGGGLGGAGGGSGSASTDTVTAF